MAYTVVATDQSNLTLRSTYSSTLVGKLRLAHFVINIGIWCTRVMEAVSDEAIVASIQAGQSEAFGELITRYEDKLRRYGTRYLPRPETVTDCVQDTFIKAYTNIQSFDTTQRFSPWIYRIAHNTFVNELRRSERYRFPFLGIETDTFFAMVPSTETADGDTLSRERVEAMGHLLQHLTPKYREIIILFYYQELSYEEISDILHIPITTVGVRLNRARTQLKQLYQSEPNELII